MRACRWIKISRPIEHLHTPSYLKVNLPAVNSYKNLTSSIKDTKRTTNTYKRNVYVINAIASCACMH